MARLVQELFLIASASEQLGVLHFQVWPERVDEDRQEAVPSSKNARRLYCAIVSHSHHPSVEADLCGMAIDNLFLSRYIRTVIQSEATFEAMKAKGIEMAKVESCVAAAMRISCDKTINGEFAML